MHDLEALRLVRDIAKGSAVMNVLPGAQAALAQIAQLIARIEEFAGSPQHITTIAHQQLRATGEVVLVSIKEESILNWLATKGHTACPDALSDAIDHGQYMMYDDVITAAKDDFLSGVLAAIQDNGDD
jgi:hypothetical protein